ncbi:oxidoreductase [Pedobacter yulinensis]|uniref:Oxidoreductase n=1 Tax=Pedobacter yulinensis TaxID=2126353 RepID=A0A2T3HJ90_9SPHI|nr:Gfo/Idh/MocA family oxidoreductase [Pedobacter yulinensis]PST82502.1 oxidoreductase [Pedobacter yulinensis]
MTQINWGMIGAGDVTEVKSGPAFSKVSGSNLVAVMRRNAEKAADYAKRHGINRWYDDAHALINDAGVNAIYIATPPDTHELYTLAALAAGKPVYVEKPMALDAASCHRMQMAAEQAGVKLTIAHYRREQPYFSKIKELLDAGAIGRPLLAELKFHQRPLSAETIREPKMQWRLNPALSGGGLFHDLAPHQLDLMLHFFGKAVQSQGFARNQLHQYNADDAVSGQACFENGLLFSGSWMFNAPADTDRCLITGTDGVLAFSVFSGEAIVLDREQERLSFSFDPLPHVQQPMIAAVVDYFRGERDNPCSPADGVEVLAMMDAFTRNKQAWPAFQP